MEEKDKDIMVSVIITTYKRPPEAVEKAVKSILGQTYQDFEILIVDDNENNSQESKLIENAFDGRARICYIKQDGNKGACAARNLGIKNARGEYIAFLDDDDIWEPEKLELQLDRLKNAPENVAMVYCLGDVVDISTDPPTISEYYTTGLYKDEISFHDQLKYDYIGSTSQGLIKKSALVSLGGFDESLPARQDYEMWLRISKNYKIYGVQKVLFHYIQHGMEQITKSPKKAWTGYKIVYKKYYDDYRKDPDAHVGMLQRMIETVKDYNYFLYQYYRIKKHIIKRFIK